MHDPASGRRRLLVAAGALTLLSLQGAAAFHCHSAAAAHHGWPHHRWPHMLGDDFESQFEDLWPGTIRPLGVRFHDPFSSQDNHPRAACPHRRHHQPSDDHHTHHRGTSDVTGPTRDTTSNVVAKFQTNGFEPADVKVSFLNGGILVRGAKETDSSHHTFSTFVTLPEGTDRASLALTMGEDGVVRVTRKEPHVMDNTNRLGHGDKQVPDQENDQERSVDGSRGKKCCRNQPTQEEEEEEERPAAERHEDARQQEQHGPRCSQHRGRQEREYRQHPDARAQQQRQHGAEQYTDERHQYRNHHHHHQADDRRHQDASYHQTDDSHPRQHEQGRRGDHTQYRHQHPASGHQYHSDTAQERQHRRGTEPHRRGTERHHRGTEAHHRGTEAHHRGTEAHHRGTEAHHREAEPHHRGTEPQRPRTSSFSAPVRTLASLEAPGYDPADLSVRVSGERVRVEGRHKCGCDEQCVETSFTRFLDLPRGINPSSVAATLDSDRQLVVTGRVGREQGAPAPHEEITVRVTGLGIPERSVPPCELEAGSSIKIRKIDARTGRRYVKEDFPSGRDLEREEVERLNFRDMEEDNDDATVEIVG